MKKFLNRFKLDRNEDGSYSVSKNQLTVGVILIGIPAIWGYGSLAIAIVQAIF